MLKPLLVYPFLAFVGLCSGIIVGYYNSFPIPQLREHFGRPRPSEPAPLFAGPVFDYVKRSSDVVMVGDSITQLVQWSEVLNTNVANRGVSGQTSGEVLARIDEVVAMDPRIVFVMVGINDINRGGKLTTLVENVHEIIQRLKGRRVIIQSILHVNDRVHVNRLCDLVNTKVAQLCAVEGVEFLDVNRRLYRDGAVPSDYYMPDGVHLSSSGIEAWVQVIQPVLSAD